MDVQSVFHCQEEINIALVAYSGGFVFCAGPSRHQSLLLTLVHRLLVLVVEGAQMELLQTF